MLQELVNVLIEVEHDCDADNQNDGEEISAEKLADDVAVKTGERQVVRQPFERRRPPSHSRTQRAVLALLFQSLLVVEIGFDVLLASTRNQLSIYFFKYDHLLTFLLII